jgi:Lantibiotic dehydratase, N terminus
VGSREEASRLVRNEMDVPPIQDKQLDLGPILVRCACFPVEMVNSMISSGLAEAATSLLDREADLHSASRRLSEELYRIVPGEADRKSRAQLIALRRVLYGSLRPVSSELLDAALTSHALTADIRSDLVRHASDRLDFVAKREYFDRLYQVAVARERTELFSVTSEEAFRKALYVASPGTLAALTRLSSATEKQRRRLEETLHSYLMRAIGRATPNGAWSGVTIEGQSEGHSRVVFAVRLDPFA